MTANANDTTVQLAATSYIETTSQNEIDATLPESDSNNGISGETTDTIDAGDQLAIGNFPESESGANQGPVPVAAALPTTDYDGYIYAAYRFAAKPKRKFRRTNANRLDRVPHQTDVWRG